MYLVTLKHCCSEEIEKKKCVSQKPINMNMASAVVELICVDVSRV